jgi:hypothetical protein
MERKQKRRKRSLRRRRRIWIRTDGAKTTSNTNEESETVDQVTTKKYNVARVERLATEMNYIPGDQRPADFNTRFVGLTWNEELAESLREMRQ